MPKNKVNHGSLTLKIKEQKLATKKVLQVNQSWCKGCGICAAFCPKDVLAIEHEKVVIKNLENCIKCGLCESRCPDYAIWVEEEI